jgi:hypothetical protein
VALRPLAKVISLKSLSYFRQCFVPAGRRNNSPRRRNHFPLLAQISGNSRWLSLCQRNGGDAGTETGDSQMRTISFILAFAFILAGPSMAGSSDNGLPGIGTFSYNGSPATTPAPQPIVVAAK